MRTRCDICGSEVWLYTSSDGTQSYASVTEVEANPTDPLLRQMAEALEEASGLIHSMAVDTIRRNGGDERSYFGIYERMDAPLRAYHEYVDTGANIDDIQAHTNREDR